MGSIWRLVGNATDITALIQAEETAFRLQLGNETQARKAAEREVQIRDEVLAVVSHDLRAPLHAISMAAQLIERSAMQPVRMAEVVRSIRVSIRLMDKLISDLLDITRINGGLLHLDVQPIPLSQLWQQASTALAEQGSEEDVRIIFEPIADDAPWLMADCSRLVQVLTNLVSNSIKASGRGDAVRLQAHAVDGRIAIRVIDTGSGLTREQAACMFKPFWQKQSGDRRGLGLGLWIARCIVEGHGGTIEATSAVDHGTVITVTLPEQARLSVPPLAPMPPAQGAQARS